jgi:predicted house-cleaning noncanonical NTP pyrophosphatase (MazG superfamily)
VVEKESGECMKYNKLVRDKIPEIIENNGQRAKFRVLDGTEFVQYLEKKLDEEVREFHESKSIEELADIFEVLTELVAVCGASYTCFMQICNRKHEERGGFKRRLCLIEIEE